jgi:pimeloyl-ACP methyl ester carboxylesterase
MLRYRIEGSGEPLLLIHGFGVTYAIWQNLAPLLKEHFQSIMIELPGIGGSPPGDPGEPYYSACADAIEELREQLGIERWAILAYSSGTRAGEAYVQRYAPHVSRAVLLCPLFVREWWSLGLRVAGQLENVRPVPAVSSWVLSDWPLYGLVAALGFNGRRHEYTYLWTNEIRQQQVEFLKRSVYELPGKGRVPFSLAGVPTLFIWGRRDAVTARPRRPRPNDLLIRANHSAPMVAAAQIAEAVVPFLTEGRVVTPGGPRRTWSILPPAAQGIRRRAIVVVRATRRRQVLRRMRRAPITLGARQVYRMARVPRLRGAVPGRAVRRRLMTPSRPRRRRSR